MTSFFAAASACVKSFMISCTSSIPTEKRNNRLSTPVSLRTSSGISACVWVAGYVIKLSTPPRLSAKQIEI